MNHLLIIDADALRYKDLLGSAGPQDLEITACAQMKDAPLKTVKTCNLIMGEPARVAPVLPEAERLVWVQSTFAGVGALCAAQMPRNYILTGVKEIFGPQISEYVFAHILTQELHLDQLRADQHARVWGKHPYRGLRQSTLGLCGFGSIGQSIAETAVHFGMNVVAYKRTPDTHPSVARIYHGSELPQFLEQVDYLVLVLPRTAATTHLINARTLAMMKPSAVLINVGRGNAVAEDDLIEALKTGVIQGAVLDVFEKEPLPPDNPLWALPNVVITPHNAGDSFPDEIVPIFLENYRRFQEGHPLKYVIDFERGY